MINLPCQCRILHLSINYCDKRFTVEPLHNCIQDFGSHPLWGHNFLQNGGVFCVFTCLISSYQRLIWRQYFVVAGRMIELMSVFPSLKRCSESV